MSKFLLFLMPIAIGELRLYCGLKKQHKPLVGAIHESPASTVYAQTTKGNNS